jgi:hypothetical protein
MSRSLMYDFRRAKGDSSYQDRRPLNPYQQHLVQQRGDSKYLMRPLTPIRENPQASVVVPPSSRAFSTVLDPDNQILFLDNYERIVNPTNAKTPPPPLWGEVLEEENYDPTQEFYDHA